MSTNRKILSFLRNHVPFFWFWHSIPQNIFEHWKRLNGNSVPPGLHSKMELGERTFNGHSESINHLLFGEIRQLCWIRRILHFFQLCIPVHRTRFPSRNYVDALSSFLRVLRSKGAIISRHPILSLNFLKQRTRFWSQLDQKSFWTTQQKPQRGGVHEYFPLWNWNKKNRAWFSGQKHVDWLLLHDQQIWLSRENFWFPFGRRQSRLIHLFNSHQRIEKTQSWNSKRKSNDFIQKV